MHIAPRSAVYARNHAGFVALVLLMLAQLPAAAQMQIPNPLIRPRSLANPGARDAAADAQAQRAAPPTSSSPAAVPLPGTAAASSPEEIYARSLNELKDRFSTFYVSAIVGKEAILRRSAAGPRAALPSAAAQNTGGTAAPISLTTTPVPTRSDTLMLSDGELLDSVGNSGALVAKVTSRQVTIYYVQETMALPGGKLIGKRAVVFAGDVENSGGGGAPVIVLERPDSNYKRMITVESKVRSASTGTQDTGNGAGSTGGNGSGTTPQASQQ
ncbi:MAG: hypothetical protein V4695_00020 [Pseudomonadota bacterium]